MVVVFLAGIVLILARMSGEFTDEEYNDLYQNILTQNIDDYLRINLYDAILVLISTFHFSEIS